VENSSRYFNLRHFGFCGVILVLPLLSGAVWALLSVLRVFASYRKFLQKVKIQIIAIVYSRILTGRG